MGQEGDSGANDAGMPYRLVIAEVAPTLSASYVLYVEKAWPQGLSIAELPCFSLNGITLPAEWIGKPGEKVWAWVRLPALEPGLRIAVDACTEVSAEPVWAGYSGVWHMDEELPTGTALDSSPHGNHGTQVGLEQANGRVGRHAKTFSGTGIVVDDSPMSGDWLVEEGGLDMGAESLSMSIWARFDPGEQTVPANPSMLHKSTGPVGLDNRGYNLYATAPGGTLFFTPFRAEAGDDDRVYFGEGSTAAIDGEWHHVAMTFERSAGIDAARFYLDGASLGPPGAKSDVLSSQVNSEPFRIGEGNGAARIWLGELDEARIGPGVWSAATVQADYLSQSDPAHFLTWE